MSRFVISTLAMGAFAGAAFGQTVGFQETFAGGLGGWMGGATETIIPTGGADGPDDPFMEVARPDFPAQLGVQNQEIAFTGDLTAAGVTGFSFELRDTGADQDINIYLGVGTAFVNFWLYNVPFEATDGVWTEYAVPLVDDGNWVQIIGSGTLADAFANSNRLLFRHDADPIGQFPAFLQGEFGIDNITVLPTPGAASLFAIAGLGAARRRR